MDTVTSHTTGMLFVLVLRQSQALVAGIKAVQMILQIKEQSEPACSGWMSPAGSPHLAALPAGAALGMFCGIALV